MKNAKAENSKINAKINMFTNENRNWHEHLEKGSRLF